MKKYIVFICLFFVTGLLAAAGVSYIQADFVLKESGFGKASLIKGKLLFHSGSNTLIYKISFPREELWIFKKDSFYCINTKKEVVTARKLDDEGPVRLFRLMASNSLNDYGISEWPYQFKRYAGSGDKIVKIYTPKLSAKKWPLGEIHLSFKDKLLSAVVVFMQGNKEVLIKTFLSDYKKSGPLLWPCSIIQETGSNKSRQFRNYKFSSFVINEKLSEEWKMIWGLKSLKVGN